MKKRIFIAIHYMEIGGAERSLLGLLNAIDTSQYDVDLFVYSHHGDFMPLIPDKINLLPERRKYSTIELPLIEVAKKGYIDIVIARLLAKIACREFMKREGKTEGSSIFQYVADYTTPLLPRIRGYYDLAISFLTPHNIVLDKVQAKRKIAWIHTDYSTIQVNRDLELKVWGKYDYIASISDKVSETFLKTFPELKKKIVLIENILSPVFVRDQADSEDVSSEIQKNDDVINLCSVGRFSDAKNFDNLPWICRKILESGIAVRWYIVGYGGMESLIREQIDKAGVKENVILLGKKTNPYPYIKACDIYVQPSRYEGKAVTVREAQMLCKPVVITDFPTAHSQLTNGKDGLIVPMDNEEAAAGIAAFIRDKELQNHFISNMKRTDYGNEDEVEKIYRLIAE